MNYLASLIKDKSLSFGEFVLSSGEKSNYFIDLMKLMMCSDGMSEITNNVLSMTSGIDNLSGIGGPAWGACPIVSALLSRWAKKKWSNLEGFIILKDGEKMGNIPQGNVVIVDDVVSTGSQALRAANIAESSGAKVVSIISIVDRKMGAAETLKNYKYSSLVTIDDIFEKDTK